MKPYGAVDKFDPGKKATSHDRSGETIDSELGGETISAAMKYLRTTPAKRSVIEVSFVRGPLASDAAHRPRFRFRLGRLVARSHPRSFRKSL